MRLLLDTRAFLWWVADSPKLSVGARAAVEEGGNEPIFSVVSGWEISIKAGLGKLKLPDPPESFIPRQVSQNGMEVLPIYLRHALRVYELPDHHQDPFDRLLVAQALAEGFTIVTADPVITRYPVEVVW